MKNHFGDPCIYCGMAHDAVDVGDCSGRVFGTDPDEARQVSDEHIKLLLRELHDTWGALMEQQLRDATSRAAMRRCIVITQKLLQCGFSAAEINVELKRLDAAGVG